MSDRQRRPRLLLSLVALWWSPRTPDGGFVMKELIHQYGAWIVFALVFLESIGLPLPGEAILVSAAIFAGTTEELGIALVRNGTGQRGAIRHVRRGVWSPGRSLHL